MFHSHLLEKILCASTNVFLCCIRSPDEVDVIDQAGCNAVESRRTLAIASIENVIDLWKLILRAMNFPSTSSVEKAMEESSTETHAYDARALHTGICILVVKYLKQVWMHEGLHTLSPTVVQSVLDLLLAVIKTLVEEVTSPSPFTGNISTIFSHHPRTNTSSSITGSSILERVESSSLSCPDVPVETPIVAETKTSDATSGLSTQVGLICLLSDICTIYCLFPLLLSFLSFIFISVLVPFLSFFLSTSLSRSLIFVPVYPLFHHLISHNFLVFCF